MRIRFKAYQQVFVSNLGKIIMVFCSALAAAAWPSNGKFVICPLDKVQW